MSVLQRTLFGDGEPRLNERAGLERTQLDDASWVDISRGWLLGADTLLDSLIEIIDWKQGRRRMYDRMLDDPRLSRWYTRGAPLPDPALDVIGNHLDALLGVRVSGPACNYYRDGTDSVAWHADRELRELTDTRIAIVTLGACRPFLLRPKGGGVSTRPRTRVRRSPRDGRRVPDGLGALGAEVEVRRPAHLVLVALECAGQSAG